ncbi:MAG TPA: NUDIX domain-containing protein [Candidatus Saccharimonadales bacterium]|nr:NUDIX domain-containing protein [Candidatus Saccharimonadales bacterium]
MAEFNCAGVLLIDPEGNLITQHRDDKPGINSPGLASFFGGTLEPEDASPLAAAVREINEETNLNLTEADLEEWITYDFDLSADRLEHEFIYIAKGVSVQGLEVYEGQGYHVVRSLDDPLLAPVCRPGAEKWFKERDYILNATAEHPEVHRSAATLFIGPDGTMYGHQRDDKPGIDQPGKIGAFGGGCEEGETSLQAAIRELHEETDRQFKPGQLELLNRFVVWRELTREYEQATIYIVRNFDVAGMKVFEGVGVAVIPGPNKHIASTITPAVRQWFAK